MHIIAGGQIQVGESFSEHITKGSYNLVALITAVHLSATLFGSHVFAVCIASCVFLLASADNSFLLREKGGG
jgi:hypothetical protein